MDAEPFVYAFHRSPWFFMTPSQKDRMYFDTHIVSLMRELFDIVRKHPNLSPDAIVAPQCGGMTAGELALLRLRLWGVRRRSTDTKRKKGLLDKKSDTKKPKKQMRNASVKLQKLFSLEQTSEDGAQSETVGSVA